MIPKIFFFLRNTIITCKMLPKTKNLIDHIGKAHPLQYAHINRQLSLYNEDFHAACFNFLYVWKISSLACELKSLKFEISIWKFT